MKTLRELVQMQQFTQESDEEIIVKWFLENEKTVEGIDIISKLAKSKIKNDENKYGKLIGELSIYSGASILVKQFGKEIGFKLDDIIRLFILGYNIKEQYPAYYTWLQETIPTLKSPDVFWGEFYDWLHDNGIYFMEEQKWKMKK